MCTHQYDEIDNIFQLLGFEKTSDSSWFDTPTGYDVTDIINNAREAIQRLTEVARADGELVVINDANNAYHDLSAPELGKWLNKELESLEVDYATLNTKQETKLGYEPVVDMGNGLKKLTIGIEKDGAE